MKLDRALIKSQARALIKGKFLIIFLIVFVVGLLSGGFSAIISNINSIPQMFSGRNPFEEYSSGNIENIQYSGGFSFGGIFTFVFAPLSVALAGMMLLFVRGTQFDIAGEFNYVFKNTFDKNYGQKFLLKLLVGIFTMLWSILLVVPGIVYHYKTYFVDFIMADNPELEWRETIELSKKMTNGHKGELFVFDLSFFLWYCLMGVTAGIAGIYVLPYVITSQALYYENFKLRALQSGELTEYDFMSNSAKMAQAYGGNQNPYNVNPNVYQPPVGQYQHPIQPQYQQPVQPQYQQPVQQYQQPAQQEQYYQPPVQQPEAQPAQPEPQPTDVTNEGSFYTPPSDAQQYFNPLDDNTNTPE